MYVSDGKIIILVILLILSLGWNGYRWWRPPGCPELTLADRLFVDI